MREKERQRDQDSRGKGKEAGKKEARREGGNFLKGSKEKGDTEGERSTEKKIHRKLFQEV